MPETLHKLAKGVTLPRTKNFYRQRQTVPRRRTEIPRTDTTLPKRFAVRLREVMDSKGWATRDVVSLLKAAGIDIGVRAIDTWLRGESMPKSKDFELVGEALGFADYRELLPPPVRKGGKR